MKPKISAESSSVAPAIYANGVQTIGGFVVHGPLTPITEEGPML